MFPVVEPA